jgi:hypothetical protein
MAATGSMPGEAQPYMTESQDNALFDFDFSQFDDFNYLDVAGQLRLVIYKSEKSLGS